MNNCGIYKITNLVNGKVYIGSSKRINRRRDRHFRELKTNIHCNKHMQSAYNKYGKDNFKWDIIYRCGESELLKAETFLIDFYGCLNREYGYNVLSADRKTVSLETREKQRLSHLGHKNSPSAIEKTAAARRGIPLTQEHRDKISKGNLGKPKSPEHIAAMVKSKTGKKQTSEHIANRNKWRNKKKQLLNNCEN